MQLEIHVLTRARVLSSGAIIWRCAVCGRRILVPPVATWVREIVLSPGDASALHTRIDREAWPQWPVARAIPRPGTQN